MSSNRTGSIPLFPVCMQSTPRREFFSFTCRDFTEASVSMGLNPEFSASASGTASNASAKARMAYCSIPGLYVHRQPERQTQIRVNLPHTFTAASSTASEQAISAAPPPYTTRLSRTRLRTTQSASWSDLFASSMIWK